MFTTPALADKDVSDLHRDGYVVVRDTFDAASVWRTEPWSLELVELSADSGNRVVMDAMRPVVTMPRRCVHGFCAPAIVDGCYPLLMKTCLSHS